jgi:adenylate cyclase class 2
MAAATETEIKLRMADRAAAEAALHGIGAAVVRQRHFEDNLLLDTPQRSLAASDRLLRLRRTSAGCVLTFKGPRTIVEGVKQRPEYEVAVQDGDALQRVLEGLGYRPFFRYQKYREVWSWQDAEVVLDETPVGTYLEIEGPLETIHRAARALGRGPEDYLTDSYAALFFAAGGAGDMVFE